MWTQGINKQKVWEPLQKTVTGKDACTKSGEVDGCDPVDRGRKQNIYRLLFPWKLNVFLSARGPSVITRPRTPQPQTESPDWPDQDLFIPKSHQLAGDCPGRLGRPAVPPACLPCASKPGPPWARARVDKHGGWGGGLLTIGRLGGPREAELSRVAVAGDDDRLFHHVDAVALHQVLKQVEDLLGPGALEGKYPWRSIGRSEAPLTTRQQAGAREAEQTHDAQGCP